MKNNLLRLGVSVVLVHAALTLPHGMAHVAEQANLSAAASAFVAIVIVIAPLAALGLLLRRRHRLGGLLLLISMLGALLFGVVSHYVLPGPDHVAFVPAGSWQLMFQLTAGLLALSEAIGALVGALILVRFSQARSRTGLHL
jgi:hypothetical protein